MRRATAGLRLAAVAAAVMGPAAAWLRETRHFDLARSGTLLDLWIVVAIASAGAAVSLVAIRRRAWIIGACGLVLNLPVVALYGFLAVFFGLGGSR